MPHLIPRAWIFMKTHDNHYGPESMTQEFGRADKATLKSTTIPRTVPSTPIGQYRQTMLEGCFATFQTCQNMNSVVGGRHLSYSMVGADICHTRRRRWSLPHASERQQCCGRRQTVLYPMAWATRLGSTYTLFLSHTLSLVKSSPSSIKGDALSQNDR